MSQINPIRDKTIIEMDHNEIGYIQPHSLGRDFKNEECTETLYFLINMDPFKAQESEKFTTKIQCIIDNEERIYRVFGAPQVTPVCIANIPQRLITTFLSVGEETIIETHSTDTTASKNSDKKEIKNKESEAIEKLQKYNEAVESLQHAVFNLNDIFFESDEEGDDEDMNDEEREDEEEFNEEELNEEEIDPSVQELFQAILKHIDSLIYKPKDSEYYAEEFYKLMEKIDYSLGEFFDSALNDFSSEEKTREIIKGMKLNYENIEEAIAEVVRYKAYKKISKEYKFTKTLLTDLEHEIQKYPYIKEGRDKTDIAPSIEELFAKFYALDIKFVKSLAPYERSSLIKLAEFYEQYSLLEKLRDNKLTPPIRD